MKQTILSFFISFFCFSALTYAQDTKGPNYWMDNPVTIENGVVLFFGYSNSMGNYNMTLQRAQSNAQDTLIKKIQNKELAEFPPIPENAKSRSTFSKINNNGRIEGTISDISIRNVWSGENGTVAVLLSCTGIDLKQEEPKKDSALELYLRALELENQMKSVDTIKHNK